MLIKQVGPLMLRLGRRGSGQTWSKTIREGAIRLTPLLPRDTRHLRRCQGIRTWHRGLQSQGDLAPALRALEHRVAAIGLNLSPAGQGGMLPDAITDSTVFAAYCRAVAARPRRGQLSNRLAVLDQ
jgi:hypothetical protein